MGTRRTCTTVKEMWIWRRAKRTSKRRESMEGKRKERIGKRERGREREERGKTLILRMQRENLWQSSRLDTPIFE